VGLEELFQNTDDDMDVDQEDEPDQAPSSPHSIIGLGAQGQASSGPAIPPRKPTQALVDQQQAETSRTRTISGGNSTKKRARASLSPLQESTSGHLRGWHVRNIS
jgi:hypothetical protein